MSISVSATFSYVSFYYAFTVFQVSALLPDEVHETSEREADEIKFHVRKFDSQSAGSRLCGYYAVAAAVSCCLRKDPTGSVYDENQLIDSFHRFQRSHDGVREPFPCVSLENDVRTVLQVNKPMLYCICQEPDDGNVMSKCSLCGKWYHEICVPLSRSQLENPDKEWAGPCCWAGIRDPYQVRITSSVISLTQNFSTYIYLVPKLYRHYACLSCEVNIATL